MPPRPPGRPSPTRRRGRGPTRTRPSTRPASRASSTPRSGCAASARAPGSSCRAGLPAGWYVVTASLARHPPPGRPPGHRPRHLHPRRPGPHDRLGQRPRHDAPGPGRHGDDRREPPRDHEPAGPRRRDDAGRPCGASPSHRRARCCWWSAPGDDRPSSRCPQPGCAPRAAWVAATIDLVAAAHERPLPLPLDGHGQRLGRRPRPGERDRPGIGRPSSSLGAHLSDAASIPIAHLAGHARRRAAPTRSTVPLRDLPAGSYRLVVTAGDAAVSELWFEVGVISKPAYRLAVTTAKRAVQDGDSVGTTIHGAFFEGTPVAGTKVGITRRGGRGDDRHDGRRGRRDRGRAGPCPGGQPVGHREPPGDARASRGGGRHRGHDARGVPRQRPRRRATATASGRRLAIRGKVSDVVLARFDEAGVEDLWAVDPRGAGRGGAPVAVRVVERYTVRRRVGTTYDWITKRAVPRYEYDEKDRKVAARTVTTAADGTFRLGLDVVRDGRSYEIMATYTDERGRELAETAVAEGAELRTDTPLRARRGRSRRRRGRVLRRRPGPGPVLARVDPAAGGPLPVRRRAARPPVRHGPVVARVPDDVPDGVGSRDRHPGGPLHWVRL